MTKVQNNNLSISFVIPIYNELASLPTLLDSITKINKFIELDDNINSCEFVLLDDGSTDGSEKFLRSKIKFYKNTPIFNLGRHSLNFGYGAAIQSGISLTKYDWVGKELCMDLHNLYLYFEIPKCNQHGIIDSFVIENNIFTDILPNQANIVLVEFGKNKYNLTFSKSKNKEYLILNDQRD